MSRRLTGFTPSGDLHPGNYIGAIGPVVTEQATAATVVFVSDLHALTLDHEPADVRRRTPEFATLPLAAGADPGACLCMMQSHLPQHAELHYLLECATGYGAAQRMIQFKEKARRQEQARVSLLTYPVLMASDILLYDTDAGPREGAPGQGGDRPAARLNPPGHQRRHRSRPVPGWRVAQRWYGPSRPTSSRLMWRHRIAGAAAGPGWPVCRTSWPPQ
jgi:hypothetical protein